MKLLITYFILTFSTFSFAQDKKESLNIKEDNTAEAPIVRITPEDSFLYLRVGYTSARFPDSQAVTMNGIGYLRTAEEFLYGIDYTTYYEGTVRNTNTFQLVMGYRVIWNKRFLPYAKFQFGQASLSDSTLNQNYGGVSVTEDIGTDLIMIWKIKFSTGIRNVQMMYNTNLMPNASFTDFYFTSGIMW